MACIGDIGGGGDRSARSRPPALSYTTCSGRESNSSGNGRSGVTTFDMLIEVVFSCAG
jgi:hypothetical protein